MKIFFPLALLLFTFGCTSPPSAHDRIIGHWELKGIESDDNSQYYDPVRNKTVFHFEEDLCKISTDTVIRGEGTWSLDGPLLKMNFDHSEGGMQSRSLTVHELLDQKMVLIFTDTITNVLKYYHFESIETP